MPRQALELWAPVASAVLLHELVASESDRRVLGIGTVDDRNPA